MQPITPPTHDLFSRERLAGYDPDLLNPATVLVVGAGALSQNLLITLALSGIGEIHIVDFDEFEPHNAPRSPLFPTEREQTELGMAKSRVVATKLRPLMKAQAPVVRYAAAPIQALGAGAFEDVDVVVSCVDNPEARAYLSDMSRWLGITLIEGGFDGPSVTLSCFPATEPEQADRAPCYRCGNPSIVGTFSCQRHAANAVAAGVIPAIQSAAATLGGLQAEAVIQALHGTHPNASKRTIMNIRTGEVRQYELAYNPDCHGIHRRIGNEAVERLRTHPHDLAETLVREISTFADDDVVILLPSPFVMTAFCEDCRKLVRVRAPEWAWRTQSTCAGCGGPSGRVAVGPGGSPTILSELSGDGSELEGITCSEAGLPAAAMVEAHSNGILSGVFRLAGTIDDLFVTPPG